MDDATRKARLRAIQRRRRRRLRAETRLPLPESVLDAMFEVLEDALEAEECDHSHRLTVAWLEREGHPVKRVVAWLERTGGFCDCEAVFNSMEAWRRHREGI